MLVPLFVAAALLAGCGGGTGADGTTAGAEPSVVGQNSPPATRCTTLSKADLVRVASVRPARQQALADAPGQDLRCSILFIDSSGQLILQLTEADGGRSALAALRQATASEVGAKAVRPLPALGRGAFVARRVLAFARGSSLVELQTGYNAGGRLQLTPAQLVRLAAKVDMRRHPDGG